MDTITLPADIRVFYITATSFPGGITDAHKKLHELVPFSAARKYFGISRPEENGSIVYRAAAEEINPGETEKLQCHALILKKGKYLCLTINDYAHHIQSIEDSFLQLLAKPGLDPQGYCVEWYINDKDVKCMVRLKA